MTVSGGLLRTVPPRGVVGAVAGRWWARSLFFAIVAAIAMWAGRQSVLPGGTASLLWPATGVVALWFTFNLRHVRRFGFDVALLCLVTMVMNLITGATLVMSLAFCLSNFASGVTLAHVLRRFLPVRMEMRTPDHYVRLMLLCLVGSVPPAAVMAIAMHGVVGLSWQQAGLSAASTLSRCTVGAAIVISVAAQMPRRKALRDLSADLRQRSFLPTVAVLLLLEFLLRDEIGFPVMLMLIAVHVTLAARFSVTSSALSVAVTAVGIVIHLKSGAGPFEGHAPLVQGAYTSFYLAVLSGVAMIQSAYTSQHSQLLGDLRVAAAELDRQLEVTAESERLYRMAFDRAPVGSMVLELQDDDLGAIQHANAEATRILGVSQRTLPGSSFLDYVDETDRERVVERIRLERDNGAAAEEELDIRIKDATGNERILRLVTSLIKSAFDESPHVMVLMEDVTDIRQAQENLRFQVLHDRLTQLPNRMLFIDRLEHALAASERNSFPVGMLYVDLDGFKAVNDTYGHNVGDELLQQVAERLRAVTRPGDTPARLGGDEFAIICPQINPGGLCTVAERVVSALAQPYEMSCGVVDVVGASVGAVVAPTLVSTVDMVRAADAAMYRAKRSGRGRVWLSDDEWLGVAGASR